MGASKTQTDATSNSALVELNELKINRNRLALEIDIVLIHIHINCTYSRRYIHIIYIFLICQTNNREMH